MLQKLTCGRPSVVVLRALSVAAGSLRAVRTRGVSVREAAMVEGPPASLTLVPIGVTPSRSAKPWSSSVTCKNKNKIIRLQKHKVMWKHGIQARKKDTQQAAN
jgi:hypothetical protein